MRILPGVILALLATTAAAGPATAEPDPIVVTGKQKKVCVVETPTGSIMPRRYCMSAAEVAARKKLTERQLRAIGDYKQGARSICLSKQRSGGACSMM
jgi:hypothetical protein